MEGRIVKVSISKGGVPKRAIDRGKLTRAGVEGDSWAHPQIHGGPLQAVLMISEEIIEKLKTAGFPLYPGALGENLTTHGLDPRMWRSGQRYRAGGALIELTKPRAPCATIETYGTGLGRAIYDAKVKARNPESPVWGWSGFYASVVGEGEVRPGDPIV